jgi:hypothetical protein
MKTVTLSVFALSLGLWSSVCSAQQVDVTAKLDKSYKTASPAAKITTLALALADKVLKSSKERRAVQGEVDRIYLDEIKKGADSKAKLLIVGALRAATSKEAKSLSAARRKEKKRGLSSLEPNNALQGAIIMSYVSDAVGGQPSLEQLGCLALARENTSWISHGAPTLALVTEALWREKSFLEADLVGKLAVIKDVTDKKKMLSSQEQKYLNNAVVAAWMNGELKAGKSPADLLVTLDDLSKAKAICFFTKSWAKGILDKMALVR